MAWQSEKTIHRVEIETRDEQGKRRRWYEECSINTWGFGTISICLRPEIKETIITPHVLEMLRNPVDIKYEKIIINELIAGISDGTKVAYLGHIRSRVESPEIKCIEQFLFDENGKPFASKLGSQEGPGWCSRRVEVIDTKMRPYFELLKALRPTARKSLDAGIELLSKPGDSIAPAYWD